MKDKLFKVNYKLTPKATIVRETFVQAYDQGHAERIAARLFTPRGTVEGVEAAEGMWITFLRKALTFQGFSGILTVLKVRDETKQTEKNMKNDKSNKWTSHNELNAEPIKARINRLQRHNRILGFVLAGLGGAIVTLSFVLIHQIFFVG